MSFIHPAVRSGVFLIAMAAAWPAAAQTASAQTAPARAPTAPPPSAWSVSADEARGSVQIAATAKDGVTRFVIGCRKAAPTALTGVLTGYRGGGLRSDGGEEPLSFYANGEEWRDAFSVRLRYAAGSSAWALSQPLSPLFLSSFSRGATLTVVNNQNQEVASFDLTGSTAATRAMRTVCSLPVE